MQPNDSTNAQTNDPANAPAASPLANPATSPSEPTDYLSNPFIVSFRGLNLLIKHAQGVFIAMLVLGMLGYLNGVNEFFPSPTYDFTPNDQKSQTYNPEPYSYDSPTSLESTGSVQDEETVISVLEPENNTMSAQSLVLIALFLFGLLSLVLVVVLFLTVAINGTVAAATSSAVYGKDISIGEAFKQMKRNFGRLISLNLQIYARILGGYLLFIIPGIRAQLRYAAAPVIAMKELELSPKQVRERSKALYDGRLMEPFGILTVGSIIPIIGSALSSSGIALNYKQRDAYSKAKKAAPPTHWLNYLGIILIILILLIFLVIAFVIIAIYRSVAYS